MLRQTIRFIQRFPRIAVIIAALLLFRGVRHVMSERLMASANDWDFPTETPARCTASAPCFSRWREALHVR